MAEEYKVDFLGRVPIDPKLSALVEDAGGSYLTRFTESSLYPIFKEITAKVIAKCGDTVE